MRTSNKVPLSVISLYKDTPVLSGDNVLNDRLSALKPVFLLRKLG